MSIFSRSILIVEDEVAVSMDIEMRLKNLGYTIAGTALDAEEAVRLLETTTPDLVLLDIQLGKSLDGLKLSKLLKERGLTVVFLTAFADNATFAQALATAPAGYVLKPFRDDDLRRTIEIALQKQEQEAQPVAEFDSGSFFIREKGQLVGINYEDVLWFEALDNYVRIHTTRKMYMVKSPMKDIEQKLPANQFIRVHRSFIVPVSRISRIEENTIYIDKDAIPIGGQYREKLMQRLRVL